MKDEFFASLEEGSLRQTGSRRMSTSDCGLSPQVRCLAPKVALLRVDFVVGPAELFPSQGNIVAPAPDSPVDEEPSRKAAPQVPLPYHVVNRVTSADTLELQHKTQSHLQQSFSGLGSTVFGRLLMNFYFFVQVGAVGSHRGSHAGLYAERQRSSGLGCTKALNEKLKNIGKHEWCRVNPMVARCPSLHTCSTMMQREC